MRRKKVARLLWKLRAMRRSCPRRDQLLLRLGAAKKEAGGAARFVQVQVPPEGQPVTRQSFHFQVDKPKLQKAEAQDGHYLLRSNLVGENPAVLWERYVQLTHIEAAFKTLKSELGIRPLLEGQAEGLNLINLLAAQWGDLFTNVGDLPQGPIASHDGETMVWPGTENRQHILGHLCLLGGHGEPVFPMSAAGPDESYLGDPLWTSLADWLDACRKRGGLAVTAHFPYPIAEVGADIVLGKSDALEIYPDFGTGFDNPRFIHWYHALSCGYRLPVVGGTDKMGAYMAVGANRTYAYLGQNEFSFANWAQAVRKGNTFMTSGPLLTLRADGRVPRDVITLGAGGGKVEVEASAQCFAPLHRIEIVMNGKIVASHEEPNGAHQLKLHEQIQVPGPAWIAARCLSTLGPTTDWHFKVLAHTSPVYLDVPGQEVFSAPAAAFLMTLIEGAETWVNNLATPSDPESMARIRQTYREARQRLHHKMHAHGLAH